MRDRIAWARDPEPNRNKKHSPFRGSELAIQVEKPSLARRFALRAPLRRTARAARGTFDGRFEPRLVSHAIASRARHEPTTVSTANCLACAPLRRACVETTTNQWFQVARRFAVRHLSRGKLKRAGHHPTTSDDAHTTPTSHRPSRIFDPPCALGPWSIADHTNGHPGIRKADLWRVVRVASISHAVA